jgi:adenosyl cobinamide kinase/adenosyl cobinamide phosphate guanylyltransferase
MGVPVLILGASGSGKTYSLRDLPNESYGLIECEKTMLPFRGGKKFARTKSFEELRSIVKSYAEKCKTVVVDDFGYCVTDLFINHIGDKDQFAVYKTIAAEVYQTIEFFNGLPDDVIVYVTMHTDSDAFNNIVPKIMGKMVNEKIDLLGMVNVCILSEVVDGDHVFIVDGKPPAKSCGIFEEAKLPNNLALIDKGIRAFLCGE